MLISSFFWIYGNSVCNPRTLQGMFLSLSKVYPKNRFAAKRMPFPARESHPGVASLTSTILYTRLCARSWRCRIFFRLRVFNCQGSLRKVPSLIPTGRGRLATPPVNCLRIFHFSLRGADWKEPSLVRSGRGRWSSHLKRFPHPLPQKMAFRTPILRNFLENFSSSTHFDKSDLLPPCSGKFFEKFSLLFYWQEKDENYNIEFWFFALTSLLVRNFFICTKKFRMFSNNLQFRFRSTYSIFKGGCSLPLIYIQFSAVLRECFFDFFENFICPSLIYNFHRLLEVVLQSWFRFVLTYIHKFRLFDTHFSVSL